MSMVDSEVNLNQELAELSDFERHWGVDPVNAVRLRIAKLERANFVLAERVERLESLVFKDPLDAR